MFLSVFTFVSLVGAGQITNSTYAGENYSLQAYWDNELGTSVFQGYYDDQNAENPSIKAHIPSDVIIGDVLRLFVVSNVFYDEPMENLLAMDSLMDVYPDSSVADLKLQTVKRFFKVSIDGVSIPIDQWFFHYKVSTSQRGYLTYIDISSLKEGLHKLSIQGTGERFMNPMAVIPFYRDITYSSGRTPAKRESEETEADFQPKPFGVRE